MQSAPVSVQSYSKLYYEVQQKKKKSLVTGIESLAANLKVTLTLTLSHFPVEGVSSSSQISPIVEVEAPFQNRKKSWKEKNTVMETDQTRKQELLCWRGPAAINYAGLDTSQLS
jgi:hypothetical protein